jgi:hypothetical protein
VSPGFLILCLIMFGVFYQKGLKFFLARGHSKLRSHLEGALVGFLVGFGFPLAVFYFGGAAKPKPATVEKSLSAPQLPGAAGQTQKPETVVIPE